MSDTRIRRATTADLPAVNDIFYEEETRDAPNPPPRRMLGYYAHVLRAGELYVAERAGAVVGFSGRIGRSGVSFLTDLFVRPEVQSSQIGAALLLRCPTTAPCAAPMLRATPAPWPSTPASACSHAIRSARSMPCRIASVRSALARWRLSRLILAIPRWQPGMPRSVVGSVHESSPIGWPTVARCLSG